MPELKVAVTPAADALIAASTLLTLCVEASIVICTPLMVNVPDCTWA